MRGARTTRHKNITRIDHPAKKTYGYLVRVGWNGVKHNKFFSDRKHGDRLGALAAAIEWRDAIEREIGKPRTEQQVVGRPRPSGTGITGVRRRRDGEREYYEATWVIEPGKLGRTRYSISKYGEAKARRLAKKARVTHEQQRWNLPRRRTTPAPTPTVAPKVVPSEELHWNELVNAASSGITPLLPPDLTNPSRM
jgi:hypothetical protein